MKISFAILGVFALTSKGPKCLNGSMGYLVVCDNALRNFTRWGHTDLPSADQLSQLGNSSGVGEVFQALTLPVKGKWQWPESNYLGGFPIWLQPLGYRGSHFPTRRIYQIKIWHKFKTNVWTGSAPGFTFVLENSHPKVQHQATPSMLNWANWVNQLVIS